MRRGRAPLRFSARANAARGGMRTGFAQTDHLRRMPRGGGNVPADTGNAACGENVPADTGNAVRRRNVSAGCKTGHTGKRCAGNHPGRTQAEYHRRAPRRGKRSGGHRQRRAGNRSGRAQGTPCEGETFRLDAIGTSPANAARGRKRSGGHRQRCAKGKRFERMQSEYHRRTPRGEPPRQSTGNAARRGNVSKGCNRNISGERRRGNLPCPDADTSSPPNPAPADTAPPSGHTRPHGRR